MKKISILDLFSVKEVLLFKFCFLSCVKFFASVGKKIDKGKIAEPNLSFRMYDPFKFLENGKCNNHDPEAPRNYWIKIIEPQPRITVGIQIKILDHYCDCCVNSNFSQQDQAILPWQFYARIQLIYARNLPSIFCNTNPFSTDSSL